MAAPPPPTFDTAALDAAIRRELLGAVTALRAEHASPDAHAHCLGIGLVEDLTGFVVAADTLQHAAAVRDAEAALEDRASFWWIPSEWVWQYADAGDAAPGRVTREIWKLVEGLGGGDDEDDEVDEADEADEADEDDEEEQGNAYDALRKVYEERIVLALERLRTEGELKNAQGEELWVWTHYADAFDEDVDDVSFARLNDAPTTELFKKRWEGGLSTVLEERIKDIKG